MSSRWAIGLFAVAPISTLAVSSHAAEDTAHPRIETTFQIANLATNPFDYAQTDVRVQFQRIGAGTVSVPAFFDGGNLWRARYTPTSPGVYRVARIKLNGKDARIQTQPPQWTVGKTTVADFVRLDPRNRKRFVRGSTRYFPLGHNQAWRSNGLPDVPELFGKMGTAGENWSRVWMNHWDNKNLDWPNPTPRQFGTLDLRVAKRWDAIVEAAEKSGIAFQMVFQHHGQYSTQVNPNWNDNPYNVKNGGFLNSPEEFFTNAKARALTKRKLRYAVARWGYSPAIMAWELFNEVQFTDAGRNGKWDEVAAWHREMATFLREQDPYHHLITTSSTEGAPPLVWEAMDYYQEHAYPTDLMTAMNSGNTHNDRPAMKPYFVGEYGPAGVNDSTGNAIHAGLWAGLMSGEAGAPQFWTWDDVEKHNFYTHFRAASRFVAASGLARQNALQKFVPTITTKAFSDLAFGSGGGWGPVTQNEFTVESSGAPAGIGALSRFLQGSGNRSLSPKPLVFHVRFPAAGYFTVEPAQIAKRGAHIKISAGKNTAEVAYPADDKDYSPQDRGMTPPRLDLPAGEHTITVENDGVDWAEIKRIRLSNYSPALGGYGLVGKDYALAWVYQRDNVMATNDDLASATEGSLKLPVLLPGRYMAQWWNTRTGEPLGKAQSFVTAQKSPSLTTPMVAQDVALVVQREKTTDVRR